MNFATLKTRILKKLGESTTAPQKWSLAEIGDFINEGYNDLILHTKILETSATLSTVANQQIYDLASDCLEVVRMYYETTDRVIKPISWVALNKKNKWFNETTDTHPWNYVNISTQKVLLYPKVSTSEADCITYWYKQIQTDLSEDTDSPSGPDVFHEALQHFGCGQALIRERSAASQKEGLRYIGLYEEKKAWLESHSTTRGGRKTFTRRWGR